MQHLAFLGQVSGSRPLPSDRRAEESSEHDRIRESILQILETRPGERFSGRESGRREGSVFVENDAVLKGRCCFRITDAIKRWEKRVVVTNVYFDDYPMWRSPSGAGARRLRVIQAGGGESGLAFSRVDLLTS
jgi:phage baseplate assembly protein W